MNATIDLEGVEYEVEFDYQPEEPMVMYYKDGSGDPGCSAEVIITEIKRKGVDCFTFFEDDLEPIEAAVFKSLEERDE